MPTHAFGDGTTATSEQQHQNPAAAPVPDPPDRPSDPGTQLGLRLFARVGGFEHKPPERALWRELLNLAISDVRTFVVGATRHRKTGAESDVKVSAAAVWSVGLTLYMRANEAGIIEDFSVRTLAADCRLRDRVVKAGLKVLRGWHVVKMERPSRRAPARWRMNLGGLDWAAIRARVDGMFAPSGVHRTPLSGVHRTPLKGYVRKSYVQEHLFVPPSGGFGGEAAASDTARGQQQQAPQPPASGGRKRDHRLDDRITSLINAIAVRRRELGRPPLDEVAARDRPILELQHEADELATARQERSREQSARRHPWDNRVSRCRVCRRVECECPEPCPDCEGRGCVTVFGAGETHLEECQCRA